jgi:hypothetical protein
MSNIIAFSRDKETKNKVRFTVDMPDVQGSIYVAKDSPMADNVEIILTIPEYSEID